MKPPAQHDGTEEEEPSFARKVAQQGRDFGRLSGIGMQFAFTIVAMAFAGYWLDTRLGSLPLFLIVGVLLGFGGGTYSMVRKVSPGKRAKPDERPGPRT